MKPAMNLKIKGMGGGHFSISSNIPPQLAAFYIPGSNIISAAADFGTFLLQLIELDNFSWLYSVYNIREDISFQISAPVAWLACKIVIEGSVDFSIKPVDNLKLKSGEFNFISSLSLNEQLHFIKYKKYVLLDLLYPPDYVLYALKYYPALQQFSVKINSQQPSFLSSSNTLADADMMNMINRLVHSPYSLNIKTFHLDLLKKLLFKALRLSTQTNAQHLRFSLQQAQAIETAKQFIDMQLPKHFSIARIAKRVGLNEQMLKTGFKEIFGMGLYSYLQQQVFVIAKKQLEETNKSVKEIAFEAGYQSANNFSAAFKKRFGNTPVQWREKFR
jgi:AraC-like DNA-binding protein